MATLQKGIILANKGPKGPSKPLPGKRKPVFGGDEDSDGEETTLSTAKRKPDLQEITTFDEDTAFPSHVNTPSLDSSKAAATPKTQSPQQPPPRLKAKPTAPSQDSLSLSTLRSTTQATSDVDPSLYDYDTFHSASAAAGRARKETTSAANGPDYMTSLLQAAEQRKKDLLRAKDRLLQRERETEGDEFKEKDTFVTEAYKAQQAEALVTEAEEKKREEEERRKRNAGVGMTGFYRGVMDEEEKRHREIQEAARRMKELGVDGSAVAGTDDANAAEREDSEAELARRLNARGANVELNEEGLAVDKRDLLAGGLNIVSKPKPATSSAASLLNNASSTAGGTLPSRGNLDAKRAMRERQTHMMEQQLEQSQKRQAEEEAAEVEKRERAAKSQKTGADISSARERYLARKREAEAEAAKARGDG